MVKGETVMQKSIGIWVDHRRAVIVSLMGEHQSIETVDSGVHSQPANESGGRGAGGQNSKGAGNPTRIPEGEEERNFDQHIKKFYREVESNLDGAVSILIFGPGQARMELKKHLESNKRFSDINIETEAADRMSTEEATRKTREHFRPDGSS
jgi:hypothetical protein